MSIPPTPHPVHTHIRLYISTATSNLAFHRDHTHNIRSRPRTVVGNCANQTWLYKSSATKGGPIRYTTNFSSAGFRFVEIFGLPSEYEPPAPGEPPTITAQFIHTDVPRAGHVTLGAVIAPGGTEDVLNRIYKMVSAQLVQHALACTCRPVGQTIMSSRNTCCVCA